MARRSLPAEWGRLAHLFEEINANLIDYDTQGRFLLECAGRFSPQGRTALDLGCGTGMHARFLAQAGWQVIGLDLSPRLLHYGRKAVRELPHPPRFVCADLAAMPLKAHFDLIYALNFVMSFLHTNTALISTLIEIRHLLSRKGIFRMDYHYYFPPETGQKLRKPWRESCQVCAHQLVITHDPLVDWSSQLCTDRITYRFRKNGKTVREVNSVEVRRISLPQDLAALLAATGLELVAHCGRFDLHEKPQATGVLIARRGRIK
ncbi:MAG: class I SAM-dependent methyltransferase [Candidatus Zipacnadales bacterium]